MEARMNATWGSSILGLGHDVVDVNDFASSCEQTPGMRSLFSTRELRQCAARAKTKGDTEMVHFAVRWAGKEAVVKAWCEALGSSPYPFTIEDFPWADVEILDDERSRPSVVFANQVNRMLLESLPRLTMQDRITWHISLSHDGAIASAVAMLERYAICG